MLVVETFRNIDSQDLGNLKQDQPSCFNGMVRVKRYRVTIEEIEEPIEVVQARLQKLWETSDNHHHYQPIAKMAHELGVELTGEFGCKREKRK